MNDSVRIYEDILSRISLVKKLLEEAIFLLKDDPAWKDRTGGYFCVAESSTGLPVLIARIGEIILSEKRGKYFDFCQEKTRRLAQHSEHLSSWESRDPNVDAYGGAVKAPSGFIFSFSGLPELGDEALMLAAIAIFYNNPKTLLDSIAFVSGNSYWKPFTGFLSRFI